LISTGWFIMWLWHLWLCCHNSIHLCQIVWHVFLDGVRNLDGETFCGTFTQTHTTVYGPLGFCPGVPEWASTRRLKPIWIYWSKR